ncbi:MAG: LPS export ABC transporter permease LptG [Acidobacteria bacterium]|nr:LPS export ABC transporter permease LptG [Acidobacteriota bacterium]
MNTCRKLIFQEWIPTAFLALAVLTFFAFAREFYRLASFLITPGISVSAFVTVVGIILTNVLYLTIPIAVLVGTVACFSRLGADQEIAALKAGGISVVRLLRPVLLLAGLCGALSLWLTTTVCPSANRYLRALRGELAMTQLTGEIRPREFYNKSSRFLLFVKDIHPPANEWAGVFFVDQVDSHEQAVYLARRGQLLFQSDPKRFQVELMDGISYRSTRRLPRRDAVTRFGHTILPLTSLAEWQVTSPLRPEEMTMGEIRFDLMFPEQPGQKYDHAWLEREYYTRLSLPFACLVFGLMGLPLGLMVRRGGRAVGFSVAIVVVAAYYLIFAYSWKLSEHFALLPIRYSIWSANVLLTGLSLVLLYWANTDWRAWQRPPWGGLRRMVGALFSRLGRLRRKYGTALNNAGSRRRVSAAPGVLLIDRFILREFLRVLGLIIAGAIILFTLFRLMEYIDEILKYGAAWWKVGLYFIFATPAFLLQVFPVCILLALLISIGTLEKTSQIVAFKASGLSLYRLILPVTGMVLLLTVVVFFFQENVLPYINQHYDNLHYELRTGKQRAARAILESNWFINEDDTVYHFDYFDRTRQTMHDLRVYRTDLPCGRLKSIIAAAKAEWMPATGQWRLFDGWERRFEGNQAGLFPFSDTYADIMEPPGYFAVEVKRADKMSFLELREHIRQLEQAGFQTLSLEMDLHKKIAYPVTALIMVLLGFPFAFRMGKRGALYGIGLCLIIAFLYWIVLNFFSALGANGMLSPLVAAWAPNVFFASVGIFLSTHTRT